jgi:hypothetical protein
VTPETYDAGREARARRRPTILNYVLTIVVSLVTIRLLRTVRRDERGWVRDVLQPEVEARVLTPPEVNVLSGGRKERRKLLRSVSGHHTRQIVKHVITAVHARAEVARVRAGGPA